MERNGMPNALMLFIRVVIGGYLVSIGWDLVRGAKGNGTEFSVAFIIIGIAFALFGIAAIVLGLRDLIKGKYAGGPQDSSETSSKDNIDKETNKNSE